MFDESWVDRFAQYVPTQQAGVDDIGIAPVPTTKLDEAAEQFLEAFRLECPMSMNELLMWYLLKYAK